MKRFDALTAEEIDELASRAGKLAVQRSFAQGVPVYGMESEFPGEVVEQWPDGRRRIVRFDGEGVVYVERELPSRPLFDR